MEDTKFISDLLELDLNGCENIVLFSELISKINENEKNIIYKDSIDFLYYFYTYNPNYLNYKYKREKLKEEYLKPLNEIIYDIKNPLLQLRLATLLLIEYKNANKSNTAKLIVKNTILFLDKLFLENSYELKEGVLFALDLNYKFQLEEEFNYIKKLKDIISHYLHSKESKNMDFIFTSLFKKLVIEYKNFYTEDELNIIKQKLYEIIEIKTNHIDTINEDNSLQFHKYIICGIYGVLILIDKSNKINIYQKIIDINLLIVNKIKYSNIKREALLHALSFANKINNEEQISKINLLIQENNKEIVSNFKPVCFNIPKEIQEAIKRFENNVDSFINFNYNLFNCILKFYPCFKVNFKEIEKKDFSELFFWQTINFDEDYLIENIDNSGLFRKYYNYIMTSYPWINILKTKLLQRFYPNKEYFYSLTYDNNIIPKGYEEIIARMFCAGIHKDYMDFFVYASVSIEAILRHIIGEDIIKNDKKNHQIQEYETLENLLGKIKKQNLLEEDTVKELRLLFCKDGFNIRNKIAHARFSQDIFNGHYMLADYMWYFLMNFFIRNYYKSK
ncbi:DUF4209 domain-containing protein [Campylobacter sp. W0066.1]|uniref:DUF4209 domain-containing protein n=1 Tax=Campylobacter sp. W0066.1 TaxID=2735751 RepID=UPI002987A10D|nr:DUF4209 domain-containing protein [Campylobacter sp. W0066.1]HEG2606415.1 DUF4209 domain-containing protein [Campylobacter lari]